MLLCLTAHVQYNDAGCDPRCLGLFAHGQLMSSLKLYIVVVYPCYVWWWSAIVRCTGSRQVRHQSAHFP